jgi:hypothetical protein
MSTDFAAMKTVTTFLIQVTAMVAAILTVMFVYPVLQNGGYIHESKGQKEMGQFIDCRCHPSHFAFGMFGTRRQLGEHEL